jgi:hypothetical protein
VSQFLKTVTFKNVAYNIGFTWKNISSLTLKNCWLKCIALTGNSIEHEEEFSVSWKKMCMKLPVLLMIDYR